MIEEMDGAKDWFNVEGMVELFERIDFVEELRRTPNAPTPGKKTDFWWGVKGLKCVPGSMGQAIKWGLQDFGLISPGGKVGVAIKCHEDRIKVHRRAINDLRRRPRGID